MTMLAVMYLFVAYFLVLFDILLDREIHSRARIRKRSYYYLCVRSIRVSNKSARLDALILLDLMLFFAFI